MFYISEYKVDQHQHRLLGSALCKDITVVTASPGTKNFSALSYLIEQYCQSQHGSMQHISKYTTSVCLLHFKVGKYQQQYYNLITQ